MTTFYTYAPFYSSQTTFKIVIKITNPLFFISFIATPTHWTLPCRCVFCSFLVLDILRHVASSPYFFTKDIEVRFFALKRLVDLGLAALRVFVNALFYSFATLFGSFFCASFFTGHLVHRNDPLRVTTRRTGVERGGGVAPVNVQVPSPLSPLF